MWQAVPVGGEINPIGSLGNAELFITIYAALVGGVLALREMRERWGDTMWWRIANIECAVIGFVLLTWLTTALIIQLIRII